MTMLKTDLSPKKILSKIGSTLSNCNKPMTYFLVLNRAVDKNRCLFFQMPLQSAVYRMAPVKNLRTTLGLPGKVTQPLHL